MNLGMVLYACQIFLLFSFSILIYAVTLPGYTAFLSGGSGFMGYGDLFSPDDSFITNPCLDLW